jgi:pimeloyl-ACP methyl ester carboxylesterase
LGHGFFLNHAMFARLGSAAEAAGVRLVSWDARGHGQTRSEGAFDYWESARDGLAVMDAIGVERAFVGGLSQGGFAALRMALTAPDRVAGLVLLDTEAAGCTPEDVAQYRGLFGAWFDPQVPLAPLAEQLAPSLIGGTEQDRAPWIAEWLATDRTRWREAAEALITRDSVVSRLNDIGCPALVLRGEQDQTCTPEKARILAEGIRGAGPVRSVADAGHGSAWTHPAPVAAEVFGFVADHAEPA